MEKGFTITYEYGDNLYVNPTNRCNFNCAFCLRHNQGSGGSIYTHNLWLKREPTKEEILSSIESHDLSQYKQLVFVGFGEPTYRFDDICWVIDQMKPTAPRSSPGWTPTAPVPSSTAGTSPRSSRAGSIWCLSP